MSDVLTPVPSLKRNSFIVMLTIEEPTTADFATRGTGLYELSSLYKPSKTRPVICELIIVSQRVGFRESFYEYASLSVFCSPVLSGSVVFAPGFLTGVPEQETRSVSRSTAVIRMERIFFIYINPVFLKLVYYIIQ